MLLGGYTMKKLLSVIVTVAMLISCISPSLVTFAADEPALVIADASFDPAARDAKATATVSIANNPGFCFGGFYLYYDSTKLEVKDGAITSLVGDAYTLEATYNVASGDKNPANALADAGVEASDDLVCVEIIVEGNDDYMLEDLFAVELNVIAELAEGETLTYGVVPGVGRNDAPYNANEDDVAFAKMIAPLWNAYNESESRVPMTDWYWTNDAKQRGFQNRTVQGGLFIRLLDKSGKLKLTK